MNINEAIQSAIEKHQAGNLREAESIYKEILDVHPENFYALHYLGVFYTQLGNFDLAIELIQKALNINPSDPHAQYNLGIALQGKGRIDDAIIAFQKTVQMNPENADACVNLGIIHKEKKRLNEATDSFRKALRINPNHIAARYNLAYALQLEGYFDEAVLHYQTALKLNPNLVGACYNLGYIFQKLGKLDESASYFEKALQMDPGFADAYNGIGTIYQAKGQLDRAVAYFEKALQLNPDLVDAYNNLGTVFQAKGQFDNAESYYQKALLINPHLAETYTNLGNVLHSQGKQNKAIKAFQKALECNPDYLMARWAKCFSQLPVLYQDIPSISIARGRYRDELVQLSKTIPLTTLRDVDEAAQAVGRQQPFFLAYQGLNDHELQKIYGELICSIMTAKYPDFSEQSPVPSRVSGEPVRIGIVSGFFYSHSNWKLRKGWISQLDKKRFTLYGYHTGRIKDHMTETARQHFHSFREDIHSFRDLCNIMRDDNLHVLIYPEIGMDPMTVKLATLRLAPVQCTSWGHPDTSGLPTIDYFLSSDLMEPPDADAHYTEKLVRLPNLSIYYSPLDVTATETGRDTFGLRPASILYLCCQSLFKYLPEYDEIYPRIAQQVGNCQFIFISHKSSWITEQFRSRIYKAFNRYNLTADNYVIFLPRLSQEHFQALNKMADIYLDSMDWSGCNTTLEAIACNLPIVTLPGKLMRGRHSAAILNMMGLTETIAESLDHYIMIAAKLGKDTQYRNYISNMVASNKHSIYHDGTCITALEDFFERVVKES